MLNLNFKSFNMGAIKKLASPHAADDLNEFLEQMPQNVGQTMLIIAGIVWAGAGALGLYTTVQLQQLTELRAELEDAESLQPIVPVIKDVAINRQDVTGFVDKISEVYQGISIKANGSSIVITGDSTAQFGRFREAVGHVQNGGSGWRVNIEGLCVGRECDRKPLTANLKINKISVQKPE